MELTKATKASDVRKAWTEALDSGNYKQGTIFLRQSGTFGEEFCCFGVLCDLAVKAGVIPEPLTVASDDADAPSFTKTAYQYGPERTQNFHLPDPVKEWAGFGTERGQFFVADLEELNDTGKSFKQIAKIISEEREAFE
jgi:hypothetical protein